MPNYYVALVISKRGIEVRISLFVAIVLTKKLKDSPKQKKIAEYERRIDKMVYALYDLSLEEIEVVEKNNMSNNTLQKLNNYFEKYISRMLIKDIELLKAKNDEFKFSYPYLLLTCSCIDLFGGIEKGFRKPDGKGNSFERFTWFITEWMGKVNSLYKEDGLAYLIYDSWRCGVVHQATLKKGFETSSFMYPRDKHLHLIKNNGRIFIHAIQFADDFIGAQKMYRKYINGNATNTIYIESLYSHLLNMIGENKNKKNEHFNQFSKFLQKNNLVLESTPSSTKSVSQEMITRLPDDAAPSAAPEEDDLE